MKHDGDDIITKLHLKLDNKTYIVVISSNPILSIYYFTDSQ